MQSRRKLISVCLVLVSFMLWIAPAGHAQTSMCVLHSFNTGEPVWRLYESSDGRHLLDLSFTREVGAVLAVSSETPVSIYAVGASLVIGESDSFEREDGRIISLALINSDNILNVERVLIIVYDEDKYLFHTVFVPECIE
ncbi:MAG: hypothetical protein OXE52_09460 [Chloroflexi bacterium]|nr:hypothetical protein [Chloroflexota bacterium]